MTMYQIKLALVRENELGGKTDMGSKDKAIAYVKAQAAIRKRYHLDRI